MYAAGEAMALALDAVIAAMRSHASPHGHSEDEGEGAEEEASVDDHDDRCSCCSCCSCSDDGCECADMHDAGTQYESPWEEAAARRLRPPAPIEAIVDATPESTPRPRADAGTRGSVAWSIPFPTRRRVSPSRPALQRQRPGRIPSLDPPRCVPSFPPPLLTPVCVHVHVLVCLLAPCFPLST